MLSSKIFYFRSPVKFNIKYCMFQHAPLSWKICTVPDQSCSTHITRIKKSIYPRAYKVRLQQPDGSSYTIRYHEPRELIRLPVDPNNLTEEEKQARLKRLKPEKKVEVHKFDDEETEIIQRSWKKFVTSR